MSKADIVSDAAAIRVHGNANFGPDMSARMVIDEGVLLYAFGYISGSAQAAILRKHGLINAAKTPRLTAKGYEYLRAAFPVSVALAAVKAQETME